MYRPNSEQIKPAKPLDLKAKLCRRRTNLRQRERFQAKLKRNLEILAGSPSAYKH